MIERICTVCSNPASFRLRKQTTDYFQCDSCHFLFSDYIDQTGLVGGQNHEARNVEQNHIRIDRIATMTEGMKRGDVNICDFGCGWGWLVNDLNKAGFNAMGYDGYNEEFSRLPEKNKYHVVTCVECIEHCVSPFIELDVINRSLVMGGVAYFETGYFDIAVEDGIPLEDYIYVSAEAGHSSIFSHHAFDLLMSYKGFVPKRHFDRNCRLYRKVKDIK